MKHVPELKLKIFNNNKMDIGHHLHDAMLAAQNQDRIVYGVYESSKELERNPDDVMLCVLPADSSGDVALQMQYTLIEAYCWENAVGLIKVDRCDKLQSLLNIKPQRPPHNDNDVTAGRTTTSGSHDISCLLIKYPEGHHSISEDQVLDYCKMISDLSPLPIVDLDV